MSSTTYRCERHSRTSKGHQASREGGSLCFEKQETLADARMVEEAGTHRRRRNAILTTTAEVLQELLKKGDSPAVRLSGEKVVHKDPGTTDRFLVSGLVGPFGRNVWHESALEWKAIERGRQRHQTEMV